MGDEWQDLPLTVTLGQSISPFESAAQLDNLMLVPNPPGSLRKYAIMHTPGLLGGFGATTGLMGGVARIQSSSGKEYVFYVQGTHVIAVDINANTYDLGALTGYTTGNPVKIVPVGLDQVIICSANDGKAWYVIANYGGSSTITAVMLPAGTIADVAWIDGYTIYLRQLSDEWYISGIDAPATINALDFTNIDAVPDQCVGCCVINRELLVFGREHVEFYYDSGNSLFPFTRQQPGVAYPGAFSATSIATSKDAVFYLGNDHRVQMISGYSVSAISDAWVEGLFTPGIGQIWGSVYVEAGRYLYSLSMPSGPGAIVYDIKEGLWHQRSGKLKLSSAVAWHAGIINAFGSILIAGVRSALLADLYSYDPGTFIDANAAGTLTTRIITLPSFEQGGHPVFESALRLDAEQTGASGVAQFDYADESASSFITHGQATLASDGIASTVSMNQAMITWARCGRYRRRRHRLRLFANNRIAINAIQHKYEVGI